NVIPIRAGNSGVLPHYLVLFEPPSPDAQPRVARVEAPPRQGRAKAGADGRTDGASESETTRLHQELAATREYLQSVIEQQEAANEELQSSNEEVQSANEELQSINEELET